MAIYSPSLEHAIAIENRNQLLSGRTEDFREAIDARFEGRAPQFKDK